MSRALKGRVALPIRIYALAKQLKLDSKSLVDICTQAGVTGKGSALASLTDDEVEKITSYVSGAKAPKAAAAPAGISMPAPSTAPPSDETLRREDYVAPGSGMGRVPVMKKPPATVAPPPQPSEEQPQPVAVEPVEAPPEPAIEPTVEPAVEPEVPVEEAAPAEPMAPAASATPTKPEPPIDPNAPVRPEFKPISQQPSRLPTLRRPGRPSKPNGAPKPNGPTIKLAPIPISQKPPASRKPKEPAAQKPDIRLPADAIRAGRAGEKPLAEHLKKHEKKRKATSKKKGGEPKPSTDLAGIEAAASAGQGRRGRQPVLPKEGEASTLGGREQRQLKRKRTSGRRRKGQEDDRPRRHVRRIRRTGANTAAPRKSNVVLAVPCTVREFSEALGVSAAQVLGQLLKLGATTAMNISAQLDAEMAELLATELGVEVDFRQEVDLEQQVLTVVDEEDEDPTLLKPRPPIITFLGHVDHGKTSLLDRVIGIDVVSGEKGGITQHIRAYQIKRGGQAIAFVDTPGHEAFTEMRARGANVTDIAVLVVAADDGIMPQTEEAISHARAAGVPIVVALNKIDIPGVNTERVYQELGTNDLLPSEWGGDTEVVKTSAITGEGVDELLETLLTVAELHEFKANPDRAAVGTCLESELHEGRGVVAKLLVEKGTMKVGDVVVCGTAFGRVKAMYDTLKPTKRHKTAGPAMPVNVTGLNEAPGAGDRFHVVPEIAQAREIAEHRADEVRQQSLAGTQVHVTLENLFDRLGQEEVQTLNIILRADVRGSIEAIKKELTKLEHPEVQIKILQATVGGVTEADVHLADASDAIIIGFNVVADEGARMLAEQRGVQVRRYDIIYQITADLKASLEGMLKPEEQEKELGRALVQRTFAISRLGTIAGCRVLAGNIERDARIRVIRENRVIGDYPLHSLRREKDDAKDVREGLECGIRLSGFNDLKEGDILEAYKVEEIARTF